MDYCGFDLNLLVAFDALMAERHVTRAARRIGLTQSAMSSALARLREQLGDDLFTRAPDGVRPTRRALELADPVADILTRAGMVLGPSPPFEPLLARRRFTIAVTDQASHILMPRVVAACTAQAPGVDLRLISGWSLDMVQRLDQAGLDLGVGVILRPPGRIRSEIAFRDVFACAVRHDRVPHEWTPATYAGLPHMLVAGEGEDRGFVDHALSKLGLARRVTVTVPHFLSAPAIAAESGLCLTLARRVLAPVSDALGLALLDPPVALPAIEVRAYWHKRDDADPAHTWIREVVAGVGAGLA